MCTARWICFEPASSARARTIGPRSMVNDTTIAAATIAVTIAIA